MSAQIEEKTEAQAGSEPPTAESLGWQLRAALPPLKLHSVSLYDPQGEVLWLSEGALGPDEQAFVAEALRVLAGDSSSAHCERDFGDGRGAVFLAIRSPQTELVGMVMVLVDNKALSSGSLAARVLSAPVRALVQRTAILLRPPAPASQPAPAGGAGGAVRGTGPAKTAAPAQPDASAGSSSATGIRSLEILEWTPVEPSGGTEEVLSPRRTEEILTFELSDPAPAARPSGDVHVPAARAGGDVPVARSAGELHVQELAKLRAGGRMRRFRILPKPPLTPEQSLLAPMRELGAWLAAHPDVLESTALHFSLAVSTAALADDRLPQVLTEWVGSSGIEPACLGFELAEATCVRERERTERLVRAIERLGCFLVLDDFTLDTGALELLRSRALRLLKVDGALTRAALRDKLAQARVVAISQAARVLGVHCAAKHIDAAATHRWLAAAGFDFAEGPLFGAPRVLDALIGELAGSR